MTDVFVSYSRRDQAFARRLVAGLEGQGRTSWVDWEGIPPTADWWREICEGIEAADTFLCLVSPNSLESPVCHLEIAHALRNNKRFIPVIIAPPDEKTAFGAPAARSLDDNTLARLEGRDVLAVARENWQAISRHNWVQFNGETDFEESFKTLLAALETDLDHVKTHTRLLTRAIEWDHNGRNPSFVLRGKDLLDAEHWLAQSAGKVPIPTSLHYAFIAASRRAASARQRLTVSLLAVGLLITIVLAITAIGKSQIAEANANTATIAQGQALNNAATSERHASENQSLAYSGFASAEVANGNQELAIALALKANELSDPPVQAQQTLMQLAYQPGTTQRFRTNEKLASAAFSPDDQLAALGTADDATLILWDLVKGSEIRRLVAPHGGRLVQVSFAADGKTVSTANAGDGTFTTWDVQTGKQTKQLVIGANGAFNVVLLADSGNVLVTDDFSASLQSTVITVWNTQTGKELQQISSSHATETTGVRLAVTADGSTLALADSNDNTGAVSFWDVATGKQRKLANPLGASVRAVQLSSDGSRALIALGNRNVVLYDINAGQEIYRKTLDQPVSDLVWSPDNQLALLETFSAITYWDVKSGTAVYHLNTGNGLDRATFSHNQSEILDLTLDQSDFRLLSTDIGAEVQHLNVGSIARRVMFTPDSQAAYAVLDDGRVIHWHLQDGQAEVLRKVLDINGLASVSNIFGESRDGQMVVMGSPTQGPILLSNSGQERLLINDFGTTYGLLDAGALSPDGSIVAFHGATASGPDALVLWDIAENRELRHLAVYDSHETHRVVFSLNFSPDGHWIATSEFGADVHGDPTYDVVIYDVATGAVVHRITVPALASQTAFSPDGKMLIGAVGSTLLVWDVQTGQALRRLDGHHDQVFSVAFSPDSQQALSGDFGGQMILWNIGNGTEILQFQGHQGTVRDIAFSSDGKYAISSGDDLTVRRWQISFSPDEIVNWMHTHRYIPDLTCPERLQFHAQPFCDTSGTVATNTPYPTIPGGEMTATPVSAPFLTPGQADRYKVVARVNGSLERWGGELWSFSAKAGNVLTLRMESVFDTLLVLKGPGGKILALNDDANLATTNSLIDHFTLPDSGTYLIVASTAYRATPDSQGVGYQLSGTLSSNDAEPDGLQFVKQERGSVGLSIADAPDGSGKAVIKAVQAQSYAQALGIEAGDVLVAVNGQAVLHGSMDAADLLRFPVGTTISLTVQHGNQTLDFQLIAGAANLPTATPQPGS